MTDTSATWNDERVEQLKKLWAEGKSASQIAAEIGGISRNAVIGKVHRLGLAGRPKAGSAGGGRTRAGQAEAKAGDAGAQAAAPARSEAASSAQEAAEAAPAERTSRRAGTQDASHGETHASRKAEAASAGNGAAAGSHHREPGANGIAGAAPRSGKVEPVPEFEQRVTIMELREGMCRWPIGDPTSPEFRFCGARSDIGSPYCDHHARIAYQPAADRRRERKAATG
jgi:GcrA cell cycle regulator